MSNSIHGFNYAKDADGIVTITMDMEGPVNSMNKQYRQAMQEIPAKLEAEEGLTGVVLASAKKTFFAGGDLKELSAVPKGQEDAQFHALEDEYKEPLRRLEKLQVPVVAAINGAALGGGMEICMACNRRIAWNSPKVVVGFPEVTLGLLPGAGGIVRSIHLLGLEKALPFLLEGTRFNPQKAHAIGLLDQLVENVEELVPVAKDWIKANPEAWAQPWDIKGHKIPGGDIWNPAVTQVLSAAPAMTFKKTRGLLPAPDRILAVAGDTMAVDFDTACRIESRGLAYLLTTKEAKNIITAGFFQMNSVNSGIARPKDIAPVQINKVGILGAGMMGQGIAYSSAIAGIEVVLKDVSIEAAEKGKAYTASLFDRQIKSGRKTEQDKAKVLTLIKTTDDYADLQGCDLVIEAVFENADLKASVIREAEQYLAEIGVFGSNTSTLPISGLAQASSRPENFIGIHFFSPVDKMPLIEIIRGAKTSDETLARVFDYAAQVRKTPIVVNDSLGFFTSRVFSTYIDEGARLLQEGIDPIVIDAMGKLVGMPVGPLTVQDEVSQQLTVKIAETHRELGVFCSKGDVRVSTEIAEMLVKEGRGGRHHGGGYFTYGTEGEKTLWPKLREIFYKPEAVIPEQDMKDRLLVRQVIESLKCLEEGVLLSVAEGNVGSLLGIGAPSWSGGFLQVVNTWEHGDLIGLEAFLARTNELETAYGDRFAVPDIVLEKVQQGTTFV